MKLRYLSEAMSTAMIAMRPMALGTGKRTKKKMIRQKDNFPITDGYFKQ